MVMSLRDRMKDANITPDVDTLEMVWETYSDVGAADRIVDEIPVWSASQRTQQQTVS